MGSHDGAAAQGAQVNKHFRYVSGFALQRNVWGNRKNLRTWTILDLEPHHQTNSRRRYGARATEAEVEKVKSGEWEWGTLMRWGPSGSGVACSGATSS